MSRLKQFPQFKDATPSGLDKLGSVSTRALDPPPFPYILSYFIYLIAVHHERQMNVGKLYETMKTIFTIFIPIQASIIKWIFTHQLLCWWIQFEFISHRQIAYVLVELDYLQWKKVNLSAILGGDSALSSLLDQIGTKWFQFEYLCNMASSRTWSVFPYRHVPLKL